jgi:CubicO group peptidase (beta-lactamase class C family)
LKWNNINIKVIVENYRIKIRTTYLTISLLSHKLFSKWGDIRLKNIGTGVMIVAAVFLAVVLVILPHNPLLSDNNTPESIETSSNESNPYPENIVNPNSNILNINAYSLNIFISQNKGQDKQTPSPDSPNIAKIVGLFNSYVENLFKNSLIPGAAVVVVYKDQIVYMKTLGAKKVGESDPIDVDTIFQIGSCTKAFTSTAIGALVDEGLMTWEDTAQQYFSDPNEFTLQDPVATQQANMKDLLLHRTGMHENAGNEHIMDFGYDFMETLYRMRFIESQSVFRTKFAYNNIMVSLAGHSAARAASTTWPQLINEKIFQPLKMDSSVATYQEYVNSPNHSGTHVIIDGVAYYVDPLNLDGMAPAGSLSCSIKDMGNWLRFQLNEGVFNGQQVVSSQSLAETHTPLIYIGTESDTELWYALGWGVMYTQGQTFIVHAGSTRLSATQVRLLPSEDLGVVVMANEGPEGSKFCELVAHELMSIYLKNQPVDPSVIPGEDMGELQLESTVVQPTTTDPLPYPIDNYVGTYYSDYYGNIKFEKVDDSNLNLYAGNNPDPYPVTHLNDSIFVDVYHQKNITFSNFENNIPQEVHTDRWDVNGGNGTFNRV